VQEKWQTLLVREALIDAVRLFFKSNSFHEVETPLLVECADPEPSIEPFSTSLIQASDSYRGYLTTSPEFSMKKLLARGSGNIFQICKSFRNAEPVSSRHNPEFTILEWYRVNANYKDIMADCENLFRFIAGYLEERELFVPIKCDLQSSWERISVSEAFQKYAGIDETTLHDQEKFKFRAVEKGYQVESQTTFQEVFDQILVNEIEPELGKSTPSILYDYLAPQAALAKKKSSDPRYAERFEFYINGIELGNAFSELTDSKEQLARFEAQNKVRHSEGRPEMKIDMDLVNSLDNLNQELGGIAVGVDRLVMLFSGIEDIRETLAFSARDVFSLDE